MIFGKRVAPTECKSIHLFVGMALDTAELHIATLSRPEEAGAFVSLLFASVG